MKSTYSLVVRGDKGKILYARAWEIVYEKATAEQAEGEAMVQLAKRLLQEGVYKRDKNKVR